MAASTTTARKSRAARAAEQAERDRQDQEPQPGQPDPPDDFGGPSSDTRDREGQEPEPEAKPQPPEPYALVDAGTYPKTFYAPQVRICVPGPDGAEQVEVIARCEHMDKYGHESEKAALACARRIASQRGLRIGAPKAS